MKQRQSSYTKAMSDSRFLSRGLPSPPVNALVFASRAVGRAVLAASLFGIGATAVAPVPVFAQAAQRVVQGKVVDKGGASIKGAVVYLKDDHTLAIKSYIADEEGAFRFGQLSQGTDYEVWAEHNGHKSGVKMISSFDSKTLFTIALKIDAGS